MGSDWARDHIRAARVARLATADELARPHLVPIVFVLDGAVIYTAVDAKPKSTTALRRLANIAVNPQVTVLVDEYDDDWTQLWWARADGVARLLEDGAAATHLLAARYPQYRDLPPNGPFVEITVQHWSGWSATAG